MGVYQDIRSNTYKKTQGVYARIHANDDKFDTKTSVTTSAVSAENSAVNKSEKPIFDTAKVQNRIAELDNLMKETDLKIMQHAKYTPEQRNELQKQYGVYKDEYWKLRNELDAQTAKTSAGEVPKSEYYKENAQMLSKSEYDKLNKQAPLTQKIDKAIKNDIPKTVEKVGRTAVDLVGSGLVGATNAVEGMVDFAVGNVGALASGVTSGFGLAPNSLSEKIKKGAEDFTRFNFSAEEILEEKKNEGTGIYEPKILGFKVRDAVNTISNMIAAAAVGGVPGFITSAAGQGIEEALLDNQSLNRAVVYGDISGAIEGLTEKMFDAVKLLGGGKFDKFLPKGAIGKFIGGSVGEGIEEVIADGINPFLKYLTYEKGTYDMPTLAEYLNMLKESAWNGFVIGLIMKGGQDISSPQIREQYKQEVYTAVDKSKLPDNVKGVVKEVMITPAQQQINQDIQNYKNTSDYSKYISQNNQQNDILKLQKENDANNVKNDVPNASQMQNMQQPNVTLPTQAEMAQKANMNQIRGNTKLMTQRAEATLQSAKIAGANDINMNKAIELNDLLRSGAEVKFYNPQNIPQGVDANRAKVANGFYSNGTVWINKNTKNAVEVVLGHELTHHLETTDSYTDLANTILDSDVFYDYIAEKGYSNVAEYKQSLGQNYTAEQFDSEMVANFVQDKLFSDQNSIDRLARQNATLVEKIKNWISDLVVSFKGTAQEKELRRIEGMYRKALEQARNSTAASNDTQYSVGGVIGARNIQKNPEYRNIMTDYREANRLLNNGATNRETIRRTGWFKDTDGNVKYEFTDEDMALKDSYKFDDNKVYPLDKILKHDILFEAYPQLRDYTVVSMNLGETHRAAIFGPMKVILLNNQLLKTKGQVEYSLIHEIQHAIQNIEGFPGARTNINGKYAYYTSLGEIESRDTSNRLRMLAEERRINIPETAKENPTHPSLENYLKNRKETDIEKDNKYIAKKERTEALKESVKKFMEGRMGFDDFEENNNSNISKTTSEDDKLSSRIDGGRRLADAGKEPAFSMPEEIQKVVFDEQFYEQFKNEDKRTITESLEELEKLKATYDYDTDYDAWYSANEKIKALKNGNTSPYDYYIDTAKERVFKEYEYNPEKFEKLLVESTKKKKNAEQLEEEIKNSTPHKRAQFEIIQKTNPAPEGGNYVWVRSPKDIKTWEEVLKDEEGFGWGDFSEEDGRKALRRGKVRVYSSYPIKNGVFVSTSYQQALDYAGGEPNKVHSREVALDSVAWINGDEGQYAKVYKYNFPSEETDKVSFSMPETSNPDIRYSMNPVDVAKNPPNIKTGLDQLKRTSRVKEGDAQSNFTKNIYNQSIFDDKFKDLALDDKNIKSYASISNKETLQEANDAINEQGQKWVDRFLDKPNGEMKATDIAGGFILMNRYQQAGDYESMIRVAEKLRKAGTQQGQTIQMFSVLGRMTPEGMTYYAQKELSKAYDEILKNKTQKWADEHADEFKLNDKDIEYIQRRVNQAARLPEGRDKYVLLGEIASRIQNKIPPQAGQGLKALARNSMLLNPKTMVRNILGNVVIVPNHIVSDFVGAGIDKAISKKTGVRTTGGFDVKALQGAKKGIYESFDDFRRKISTREMGGDRFEIGQGKSFYENHTGRFGETRNKINKALNGLDRVTGFLLEIGDRPFYETWFINSLNNQMKLNNATEPTAEMIEIATDEALQRTWQDSNAYTGFVTSFRKGLNKLNIKGYGLGDIVMPFVKTPANLTKAVVDFSPLGAINAAVKTSQFNKDIGKGVATTKQQREVVKAWSQVITGTIGMAIMTAMVNAGILGGGSDEDKDVRNFEQKILGIKPYSIKIDDNTYTYDWAQPLGTSAAMVADTVKSLKNAKDTEGKVAAALEGLQSGASVLLEQSFVSGIRQFFEEDGLISALIEAIFNEPTKFTPQFLSQLSQLQDDTERVSYVYNNIPQTALNKIKAKIPGLRQTLEPKVDVLGREVKIDNSVGNVMFNPANTAFARTTKGAEEMYRVYQATGDKAAIAQVAPYYFDVGSDKVVLTPAQITQYQKTIGRIASDGVENLLQIKSYKDLPDTEKAEVLKDLYSYGNAIAKTEASTKYLLPKDMAKIKNSGMKPEEYILLKRISNLGGDKKDEKLEALITSGYSAKESKNFLSDYKGYKFN